MRGGKRIAIAVANIELAIRYFKQTRDEDYLETVLDIAKEIRSLIPRRLLLALLMVLMPSRIWAASWYVSPTGSDSLGSGSRALPLKTLTRAFAMGVGGDTYILMDGLYNYTGSDLGKAIKRGQAGAYTVIKAENDGGSIVTTGIDLSNTLSYVQVEGLRFHDSMGRNILGNHIKFLRNEFRGGCPSGNCAATTVGSNDFSGTADILFEDNWFHGTGGRYNLLVYNADRVVVRRAVIRHDGGWTDTKGDPEAGINFYNSSDCSAQNVIVVDSDLAYHTWEAAFYNVKNDSVSHPSKNNSWIGVMAIRTKGYGMSLDGSDVLLAVKDAVLWDNAGGGITLNQGTGKSISIKNTTIGRSKLAMEGSWGGGIGFWGSGNISASGVIIKNRNRAFEGVSMSNVNCFGNSSCGAATGKTTYDPETNGMKYLGRLESGSPLAIASVGATVVNRIGSPGTLQGENGWNTDTGVPLWPWPNEARIKKEMCEGVSRGLCSDSSLTNYVWNYLGRGNPYSGVVVVPTPTPTPTPLPPTPLPPQEPLPLPPLPPPLPPETVKDKVNIIRSKMKEIDVKLGEIELKAGSL